MTKQRTNETFQARLELTKPTEFSLLESEGALPPQSDGDADGVRAWISQSARLHFAWERLQGLRCPGQRAFASSGEPLLEEEVPLQTSFWAGKAQGGFVSGGR